MSFSLEEYAHWYPLFPIQVPLVTTVSHDTVKSIMHFHTEIEGSQVNTNKNSSVVPAFCLD